MNKTNILIRIYTLTDENNNIRYVGMTNGKLQKRLTDHISESKNKITNLSYKDNWIKSLLNRGIRPNIILIEEVRGFDNGCSREIYWIDFYKRSGCKLTNLKDGGVCGYESTISKRNAKKREHFNCNSKTIYQFNLNGRLIKSYKSFKLAQLETGIKAPNIWRSINYSNKFNAGEFLWSLTNECPKIPEVIYHRSGGINQFDKQGNFIRWWKTLTEASEFYKLSISNISGCANNRGNKTARGFIWRYSTGRKTIFNTNNNFNMKNNMVSGNISELVQISKTQFIIARGMGLTVPQLASKYQLSTSQIKLAMEDMGLIKKEAEDNESDRDELTVREQKFLDVCTINNIAPDTLETILSDLGMEYKTGRRSVKGGRKFIINDDLNIQA